VAMTKGDIEKLKQPAIAGIFGVNSTEPCCTAPCFFSPRPQCHSATKKHVRCGGSFRRKQSFRPLQMQPQSRQSLALARINAALIAIGCPYSGSEA